MMEYRVKKYETYKGFIKFMLIASGVWPNYESHTRIVKNFLNIFSAFACATTFYSIVTFCVTYFNIKRTTSCLGLMIGFFSAFIKVCIMSMSRDNLLSLNKGISTKFEDDLKVPENRLHLLNHFSTFCRYFYLYTCTVGISVLLLIIMPLLMLRHGKYIKMYPQLLPFNYEPGGVIYWIIYGYDAICGFYLWCLTCGVDSFFGLYVLHLVGEMKLLNTRFQNLHLSYDYKKDFKKCIKKHILLIESHNKLQQVFGFLTIWLAITCAIALCTLAFQAIQLKNTNIIRIMYLSCHCFMKFIQALSYAWYGNIITVESEECIHSIYNSHWPESGDKEFMKDVFMVLLQHPMYFTAKNWMILRLEMFIKVVNTTVSYFFLLRTLDLE